MKDQWAYVNVKLQIDCDDFQVPEFVGLIVPGGSAY